uniref:Zgc:100868 n=1 Tax=Salarias fasciatus TaxID=181472 RepID=A0A672G8A1_SALFA
MKRKLSKSGQRERALHHILSNSPQETQTAGPAPQLSSDNLALLEGALLMSCVCMCSVCGIAPQNNRIVGGVVAPDNNWPWQASVLSSSNRHFCGGFLVNDVWVLSAAHCFEGQVRVAVGRQRQFGSNPNQVIRNVDQIINHPEYNTDTSDNDIALLRLESAVPVNEISIVPICLAAPDSSIHTGVSTFVTGWVKRLKPPLMEVRVPIVGNRQCNCNYGVGRITDNMICAGEEGKDACQGDSGGPLVTKQGDRWVGIGVVSFGFGCARPDFPGVYARVSRYMSWINENIETNQEPPAGPPAGAQDEEEVSLNGDSASCHLL